MTVDRESGVLRGANLGDSGLFVLRDNKIIFQSQEQQYYFNAPYQLSILPPGLGASLTTEPGQAQKIQVELRDGDVIVLATDGFLDNVHAQELPLLLAGHEREDVSGMASMLVHHALKLSEDAAYLSPFSLRSRQHYKVDYFTGGKPDDITVVVAVFHQSSDSNQPPPMQAKL